MTDDSPNLSDPPERPVATGPHGPGGFGPANDLPAVRPPSTSFFVQLFLLPALIVFGIMIVWFLFGKLAGGSRSPDEYLEIIKSNRGDRWKAAHDLSHLLRNDSAHTKDEKLAKAIADELQRQVDAGPAIDNQFTEYLAGAAGSFDSLAGLPALRGAMAPDKDAKVRRAALLAVARLSDRRGGLNDPELAAQVQGYLADENSEIRELAAYTLGFLNGPQIAEALRGRLTDPQETVRYNAAVALASHGDPAAVPVLAQMLDTSRLAKQFFVPTDREEMPDMVDIDFAMTIQWQAMQSIRKLRMKAPQADLTPLLAPLRQLAEEPNATLRNEARDVLLLLQRTPEGPAADARG